MADTPRKQMSGRIRPARMGDVRAIHTLLSIFATKGLMLPRSISSLYDHLRDFVCLHRVSALHRKAVAAIEILRTAGKPQYKHSDGDAACKSIVWRHWKSLATYRACGL